MKIKPLNFLLIITEFVFVLISGCSKEESPASPELTVTNNGGSGSMALAKDPAEIQQILSYFQQNNIEHGAFFYDVSNLGFGLGVFDFVTGKNATFRGDFGPGDFLRVNPDGTYSLKLVTNQADATTIVFTGGIPPAKIYKATGTAHMNYKFSGTNLVYIPEVQVSLIPDGSINAVVFEGHATVYQTFPLGQDPNPHTLRFHRVVNPGGQSHFEVTLD